MPTLQGMQREISSLKAKFPGRVSFLDGSQATQSAVLQEIPRHEWLHLACHASSGLGGQHPPSLLLHDGRLRIERLGWTVSDNAQLAYHSGCSTAEAMLGEADEARHLTALQAAGFSNAIGTFWAADDQTGAVVAGQFYDRVNRTGSGSGRAVAEALHHTLRSVRDAGLPAFHWAPYVHYGI